MKQRNAPLFSFYLVSLLATPVFSQALVTPNWQNPLFLEGLVLLQSTRALTLGTIAGGRLTAQSGVPIPVSDQVGQSTLYFTPYMGAKISLFDGASWQAYNFAELSIAVPAGSYGDVYDVFLYPNSGSPTLELTAWTNPTTRNVALGYLDGVRVKGTDSTRRYLGSIGLSGSGTTEDSEPRRFVWNLNNQVERYLYRLNTTAHAYNGPTRAFNGDTANRLEFVTGEQSSYSATVNFSLINPSPGIAASIGLDENACASYQSQSQYRRAGFGARQSLHSSYSNLGYNYLCILQGTESGGSTTFNYFSALGELLM